MVRKYKIFVDDERFPKTDGWLVIRTCEDAKGLIELFGLPNEMSLDNDMGNGEGNDVYDFVKWMVNEKRFDLREVDVHVHSANPVAEQQIYGLIKNWNKFLDENPEEVN